MDDEEKYRHYALNVPLYTHFTSPIRRYPDLMVHRMLAASLGKSETLFILCIISFPNHFNSYSAGTDFSCQNLTSNVDPRTVRENVLIMAVDP